MDIHIPVRGLIVLTVLVFLAGMSSAWAEKVETHHHRVLLLHSFEPFLPYSTTVNQSVRQTLLPQKEEGYEFYSEYLDLARFSDPAHESRLVTLLREKYRQARPDVVIAVLVPAFDFALRHRKDVFSNAPLIFCGIEPAHVETMKLDRDVTGVLIEPDPKQTLEAALRLQPDTERVVVVGGTSKNDKSFNSTVLRAFEEYAQRLQFAFLIGKPIDVIYEDVAKLPPRTIVFYVTMFQDGEGKAQVPAIVAGRLSKASSVPVYGLFDSYFGSGIVGGRLVNFEMQGKAAGEIAYRILHGESPASIPYTPSPNTSLFDWRQLKKWGLSESRLLPLSVLRFKEYTLWDLYRWWIFGVCLFMVLEAFLIVFLLIHRARRRKAEKALRLTQFSLDHASDAVISLGPDGRFLYVNDSSCRYYSHTKAELLAMRVYDLDHEMGLKLWQNFVAEMKERKTKTFEARHRRKDGAVVFVEVRVDLFEFQGERHILAFIRDITEQKRAQEALISEKERFLTLADNAPFGLILVDSDDVITYRNPIFNSLFGYDQFDAPTAGAWFSRVFSGDAVKAKQIAERWRKYKDEGSPAGKREISDTVTCKDGAQKVVRLITVPLKTGEIVITIEDISERKQLESQLVQAQKMEAVGTLAGGVAHDFNNILSVITGFAGLLNMQMPLDPLGKGYVEQILAASEKAVFLTSSLLAFSRKQMIDPKPVDLNTAIEKTRKILSRLIGEDIEMTTVLSDGEPVAMVDEGQLDQILINLAANARDAMPNGGSLMIKADISEIDEAFVARHGYGKVGTYATLSVSDTGEGMDEKTKERIFEPFFTTKEVGRGTGLGLSIVYGIVKQHSGYIVVETVRDLGTTFTIFLPFAQKDQKGHQRKNHLNLPGGSETILIGEDEETLREFLKILFESMGYSVICASDGEDTVRGFKDNRDAIDLVLLDVVMPKMNGREVYREIRKMGGKIPVVFCSGYTFDTLHRKGIQEEGLEFIQKPLKADELLRRIRNVLDSSGTSQK